MLLNIFKTILKIILPLITFPYVARVLQVETMGKVNYAISIISYFQLFAMLGVSVYAVREGAQLRDDNQKLSAFSNEVFSINVFTTVVSYSALLFAALFIPGLRSCSKLLMLLGLSIPLTTIGTEWINIIFEDYVYITLRYIFFQIIAIMATFLLIHSEGDFYRYAICILISGSGPLLLNVVYVRKYVKLRIVYRLNIKRHLRPILLLFATNLSSMIYSSSDTLMLGIMTNDYHVGIYSTAAKIYNAFKQVIFSIVVVCLPRFAYLRSNTSRSEYELQVNRIFNLVFMLAIPLVVGVCILSTSIISVIAGNGYEDAVGTLRIKAFAIFFAILAYFNMQLILLPDRKDKEILISTSIAGLVNILGNIFFIPMFFENAAAFTTVLSELIVYISTCVLSKKVIKKKIELKNLLDTILVTVWIGVWLVLCNFIFENSFMRLFIGVGVSIVLYFGGLMLLRNYTIFEIFKISIEKQQR